MRRSFLVALLLGFSAQVAGQGAVDLRRSLPIERDVASAPASLPEPELRPAALRAVLDDLAMRLRYLKAEARFLAKDARSLWSCWAGASQGSSATPRTQRLQAQTFAFYGDAIRLEESLAGHDAALKEAGRLWAAIGRDDPERLRSAVAAIAARVDGLDTEIRRHHAELDRLYPRLVATLAKNAPQVAPPPRPWHWAYYMDANRRRPEVGADFETLYREQLRADGVQR